MPNPAKKSLVDVLKAKSRRYVLASNRRSVKDSPSGKWISAGFKDMATAVSECAKLAEPYEARREALEKVAEAAQRFLRAEEGSANALIAALAAVPPLPEVQDGS